MEMRTQLLKTIPNVQDCLAALGQSDLSATVPLARQKHCVRIYLDSYRRAILAGDHDTRPPRSRAGLMAELVTFVRSYHRPRFTRVINATGVVVHTNLGRSRLPASAGDMLAMAALNYSNLEFNLATGRRGSRYDSVTDVLCELTGAEDALVVNNNAAAVLIALDTLARDREVVVSRGQLVEIGGSFRIPDVMRAGGARLVEVGTTNRTHLQDYVDAINERTALLLRVHCSNFRIIGFTSEVANSELVQLGRERSIPVMEDLGSGCLVDLSRFGLAREPTVREVVASGMDIVTFSGDKLLGSGQAGIIAGRRPYIDKIKQEPLLRAVRIDKLSLAALEGTLTDYLMGRAAELIPGWGMLNAAADELLSAAQALHSRLSDLLPAGWRAAVVPTQSLAGGGSLPAVELAGYGVELVPEGVSAARLERLLRQNSVPVVALIREEAMIFDVRCLRPGDDTILCEALGRFVRREDR